MTTANCLKKARALLVDGGRDLYGAVEQSAATGAEQLAALEALELQAAPARAAFDAAVDKFTRSQLVADGIAAVEASKRPGADFGLWDWVHAPERRRGHVFELFNRAIKKST